MYLLQVLALGPYDINGHVMPGWTPAAFTPPQQDDGCKQNLSLPLTCSGIAHSPTSCHVAIEVFAQRSQNGLFVIHQLPVALQQQQALGIPPRKVSFNSSCITINLNCLENTTPDQLQQQAGV